ncbi:MAG: ZIP family metal transporter [Patescibacteria group bacterium]|nr:ZIP family metal transporter [Patescibacteria group bacterium]MDE1940940.1 ZIP family metal transporter [Patescibacteria group bacterium]MDE1966924.1 ZIP family metal transporter [Patescibacteria group bacterium]
MVIIIALATFVSTFAGGLLALRFKDKLHLILGFSAGAVIGVAFFDLLPESIGLGSNFYSLSTVTAITAAGFLFYLILDRVIFLHSHAHEDGEHEAAHIERGVLGAGSLSFHSFLDGLAIGLAFQLSAAVGAVVAVAVLVHDFSDGINTVNLILKNQGQSRFAFRWLIVDAMAPVLGAASTLFFRLPEQSLAIILSLFAGFFMYIGASDLVPESHHAHPKFLTTAMTLVGAAVLFAAIKLANL